MVSDESFEYKIGIETMGETQGSYVYVHPRAGTSGKRFVTFLYRGGTFFRRANRSQTSLEGVAEEGEPPEVTLERLANEYVANLEAARKERVRKAREKRST